MSLSLKQFTDEHRYVMEVVARAAGFADPVAFDASSYDDCLLRKARKGKFIPFDGALVRFWDACKPRYRQGMWLGVRLYTINGIRFARVAMPYSPNVNCWGYAFNVVDRADHNRLFRLAVRLYRDLDEKPSAPPVLSEEQRRVLWQNTIGFLENANLKRYESYGARARRGIMLMGPPGNGKTMACRWILEECQQRGWEWDQVTPDSYRQARLKGEVRQLFSVGTRGVIFFDDMDLALRDRETVHETEDQAVFLTALDGINVNEGVVFVFTSNCAPELLDRAFKRPGRLDVVLKFDAPSAALRRQLVERWHADIRHAVSIDSVVASTDGCSFAEIEELKNLLVMEALASGKWDWAAALHQFDSNRQELNAKKNRKLGFGTVAETQANGSCNGH